MSVLWVLAVFAWPSRSHAKPLETVVPIELQPMSGPFADLSAACKHLEGAVPSESANTTWVAPARCKQIDASASAAVLLAEREELGGVGDKPLVNRVYAVVLHRRDGWWMSPDVAHSYRDRDAANKLGGNCCYSAESPPKYAVWSAKVSGFEGSAKVLRIVMHGWSVFKKGWPGEGEPGNSQTQVSFTICGTTSAGVASCYAARSACSCIVGDGDRLRCLAPQVPKLAIEDDHVVLQCP